MKTLRHVCVYGDWFTIKTKPMQMSKSCLGTLLATTTDRSQIFRRYKKPSDAKLLIWLDWCDWATKEGRDIKIRIRSSNPRVFTIEGIIYYEGLWYYIDITPSHNYLYPIEVVERGVK